MKNTQNSTEVGVALPQPCSAWIIPDADMPETYAPVIVAGALEDEDGYMATHEAFWCGRNWWSVRSREETSLPEKKRILHVTHWMLMPTLPNAESIRAEIKP